MDQRRWVMAGSLGLALLLATQAASARAVEAAAAPAPRRATWIFGSEEHWDIYWPNKEAPKPYHVEATQDGLLLTIEPAEKELSLSLVTALTFTPDGDMGNPGEIRLSADLLAGPPVAVMLNLRGAQGGGMCLGNQPLPAGPKTLVWPIADEKILAVWGGQTKAINPPLRFWNIAAVRPASAVASKILFRRVEVKQAPLPLIGRVDVEVVTGTGSPIHVLKVGEEEKLALRFRNDADEPVAFVFSAKAVHFDGDTVTLERKISLAAHEVKVWEKPFAVAKRGFWKIDFTLKGDVAAGTRQDRLAFCLMQPAGPTLARNDAFLLGVNVHEFDTFSRTMDAPHVEQLRKDRARSLMAVSLCGAKVLRGGIVWESLQHEKNKWDDKLLEEFDLAVNECKAAGIEFQWNLCYSPHFLTPRANWADMKNWYFIPPPDKEAWLGYVRKVVGRFGDRIRLWEIWNEPDLSIFWNGTCEQYMDLLKTTYPEIKKINSTLQVMTGGFATVGPHSTKRDPDFELKTIRDAQPYYDIFTHHEHGTFNAFERQTDGPLAELRKLAPAKPLYFNETAIWREAADRQQPETIAKKVLFAWSRGAMGYTWYEFRGGPRTILPTTPECWGMITDDFYPNAVYPVFNTIALVLGDKHFEKEWSVGEGSYAFLFGGKDEYVLGFWRENKTGSSDPLVVQAGGAAAVESVDLMGNVSPAKIEKGHVLLMAGPLVQFLVFHGAKRAPQNIGPLLAISGNRQAYVGQPVKLSVTAFNPFEKEQAFALNWDLPPALGIRPEAAGTRQLAPGAKETLEKVFTIPRLAFHASFDLRLHYKLAGTAWEGEVPVPLVLNALIPAGGGLERQPDFELTDKASVVNLNENAPGREAWMWKGPQDLSARIWLGRDGQAMTLHVAVQDDVHAQKYHGVDIWRGDSLQVAFQVPGQKGYWEIGLARLADGTSTVYTWGKPQGFHDPGTNIVLQTALRKDGLDYSASFPYAAVGLSDAALGAGIRFNVLVSDDDDDAGRKQWIQIAPGIAESKNPVLFPTVVFEVPAK